MREGVWFALLCYHKRNKLLPMSHPSPDVRELVICANMWVRMNGQHLLLKRAANKKYAPNYVHPIGGKVEENENPLMAAERELMEEAGITVKNIKLEGVFLEILPHKALPVNWLIYHFSGDYDTGELRPTDEGEFVMLDKEEIATQNLFPSVRETVEKLLDSNVGTVWTTFRYDDAEQIDPASKKIDECIV